jgi:hypothetical protein
MTLFQAVQILRTIAENHSQIRTFGEGDIYDFVDNGNEIKYPVSWVVVERIQRLKNVAQYEFILIFADLLLEDKSNKLQIQSDLSLVAIDFLSKLKLEPGFEFTINEDVVLDPFQERFDDFAAGVSLSLKMKTPFPLNLCSFPSKP